MKATSVDGGEGRSLHREATSRGHRQVVVLALGLWTGFVSMACDRSEKTAPPPKARRSAAPSQEASASSKPLPGLGAQGTATATLPGKNTRWRRLAKMWLHPNPLPNFQLTNQDGKPFFLAGLAKHYLLVGFIFTTCGNPKACPRTTQKMHDVARLWQANAKRGATGGRSLHLLTCTIDPDSDSPAVLKSYGEALRKSFPDWTFATGPEELMSEVLPAMFGVRRGAKKGATEMAHTVKVALLKPGLRPYKEWLDNDFEPGDVVKLIQQ
jgi:cytochrome oxidase Cu insertion factor (SCO1/SenC/PrrC family)